jgi:hypothetical protein
MESKVETPFSGMVTPKTVSAFEIVRLLCVTMRNCDLSVKPCKGLTEAADIRIVEGGVDLIEYAKGTRA